MPSTYSPNLNLELQATGDHSGTWGSVLNANDFSVLDAVLGNTQTISLSSTDVTLTTSQTQNNIIKLTGVLTANVNLIAPAIGRTFFVQNNTTGAFTVTFKIAGAGATALVAQGTGGYFVLDGTNVYQGLPLGTTAGTVTAGNDSRLAGLPLTSVLTSLGGLPIVTGDMVAASAANTLARLPKGNAGALLQMDGAGTNPVWGTGLGIGQSWTIQSKTFNTSYVNNTAAPIFLMVTLSGAPAAPPNWQLAVGAPIIASGAGFGPISAIIPSGTSYFLGVTGTFTINIWAELR